jgi:hypothetical protein
MLQEILGGMMAATTGLTALFMILRYRSKGRSALSSEHVDRLIESQEQILNTLEDLREEVNSGQSDVRELSGRVEFAERLLAKTKE